MMQIPATLYHGTISEFTDIDVSKGKPYKDFGKGFYTAIKISHATAYARLVKRDTIKRLKNSNHPYTHVQARLYTLSINNDFIKKYNMKIKEFHFPDFDWIDFVIANRENRRKFHEYDIVIGPTADDDTATCLDAYRDGLYGEVGSPEAKATLIKNLEPGNLPMQIYFGTLDAVQAITIKKVEILP